MSGFLLSNTGKNIDIHNDKRICDDISFNEVKISRNTINEFAKDKCWKDSESCFHVLEGVLLNKHELFEKYACDSVGALLDKMESETFFSEFRGSFSGIRYQKKEDTFTIFTNHYADNGVFYYYDATSNKWIVSSQIDWIIDSLKVNNINYSLDKKAVFYMLVYAFMADNCTYAKEIKRLLPGEYIIIRDNKFVVSSYYKLGRNKIEIECDEDEIIEEMDRLFRRAIKREYDKDLEYGKKHLAELSGGLDSRMGYWVARQMGYENIQLITFGQSNYLDEMIAKQIAAYWNNEIIVWPMDSGKNLFDIDRITKMNFGVSLYSGCGAELHIMDALDMKQYGLMHTGQIGDVVFGTFIKNEKDLYKLEPDGMYNDFLKDIFQDDSYKYYDDKESQLMTIRALVGCLGAHFITREYTEVASPFLDVDIIDYMMSIPINLRINHNIYKKWIVKKYPEAAEFIWEKTKGRITESNAKKRIRWMIANVPIAIKNPRTVLRYLGVEVKIKQEKTNDGMSPMDLWVMKNHKLGNYLQDYFDDMISDKALDKELQEVLKSIFLSENVREQTQVLTVLAALKLYRFS